MKNYQEKPLTRREKREIIENQHNSSADFRRGATISGVQKEKSERVQRRELIVRRRKISGFFAFLCAVIFVALVILTQIVVKIDISVNGKIINSNDSKKYISAIDDYYNSQPIERLRSYLKKDDLLAAVQKNNPEVQDISQLTFSGFGKYTFELKMRKPVAIWNVSGKEYFVDEAGKSFEKNYYEKPSVSVVDEGANAVSAGENIASNGFISFVGKVVSIAKTKGLTVSKVVIPATSLRQADIYIDGISYPVKMLITSSPEGQVNNLVSAINKFNKLRITPSYLDLRVEGLGYYK